MTKKKKNKFKNKIVQLLKKSPGTVLSRKDISHALNVHKQDYNLFHSALQSLVKEGKIVHVKKHQYALKQVSQRYVGELRTTRAGFGFVNVEDEDFEVFVAQPNLNRAFDRDIVEVQLYAASRGKRLEGFVRRVVKRFREFIVGTYHKNPYYSYVAPDDPKIYRDIIIPPEQALNAEDGQKVIVKFEGWERNEHNPVGSIIEILGDQDTPGVDIVSIAYSYNLPIRFSAQVQKDAQKAPAGIRPEDLKGRLDLRNEICFTIDPDDAKDFDDAISLKMLKNGNFELGVHIADVSHYVKPDTALDKEAFRRGTSVYMVDRVVPMLPERLSNELCSLRPNEDRLTFSCIMEIDRQGEVVNYKITPSVINSKRRYSYEEVQEILDGKANDSFAKILKQMDALREILMNKRFTEGGIDFDTPEVKFILDEKGTPVKIVPKTRLNSHRLVEEFMLIANKTVAQHIKKISPNKQAPLPFIYRVHEKPDEEKMNRFFNFLSAMEVPFKPVKRVTSRYMQNLLSSIKGTKEEVIIEEVALRSMMKAVYSEQNIGHFGLGFKDYTHFTSPIRRYPDLVVHRLLRQYSADGQKLKSKGLKKALHKIATQSTKMERLAMEAERESIKLKQLEYIEKYIGEEFEGLVSGVQAFGVFVELKNIFVEGIIPIETLTDDFYIYDEPTFSLIGRDTSTTIRLGDEVRIRVEEVDFERRRARFSLLENISDEPGRSEHRTHLLKEQTKQPKRLDRSRRKR
ncbi:MAG: ribonuclease R [Caldisericaceae bacterium]|nr:ribonuclease R [Caldisericaceae bacterium]